jgi:hypothetical protein
LRINGRLCAVERVRRMPRMKVVGDMPFREGVRRECIF